MKKYLFIIIMASAACISCATQEQYYDSFYDREYERRAQAEMQDVTEMVKTKQLPVIDFKFNSDKLKPESYPTLDKIASILIKYPKLKLVIEGHTDHVGSYEYNDELSMMRALSVKRYLATKGVRPDSMKTYGYGKRRMLTQGTTKEDMALNRRVEFILTTRDWHAVF